jgi:DNA (cytosine-5)-methyltransferase 1
VKRLTVGSLCSGIGGLDLGLERAGMDVIWQAEVDPYASKVLAKHWPTIPNLGDITTTDWSSVDRPDLICAGYPCQPFSLNGDRRGADDPRHLWPIIATAIRHLAPRFVVLENVRGHISLGLDKVLGDLACLGFDAEWGVVPACAVGAPHRRDRVFVVAYSPSWGRHERPHRDGTQAVDDTALPAPLGRSRGDEHRGRWAPEPGVGRVADGISHRVDRLRALGNAVVPQVAELIGRMIVEAEAP